MVPKEGGNAFTGTFLGEYAGEGMQGNNLTNDLKARGLPAQGSLRKVHDIWGRVWGPTRARQALVLYSAPGLGRPGDLAGDLPQQVSEPYVPRKRGVGVTLRGRFESAGPQRQLHEGQQSPVDVAGHVEPKNCRVRGAARLLYVVRSVTGRSIAPEASYGYHFSPNNLFQATWSYPASNRILIEAGWTLRKEHHLVDRFESTGNAISVIERTLGRYGAVWSNSTTSRGAYGDHGNQGQQSTRFALSYVTGSHAFKAGVTTFAGQNNIGGLNVANNSNVQYVFRNGVPESINLAAYPHPSRVACGDRPGDLRGRISGRSTG